MRVREIEVKIRSLSPGVPWAVWIDEPDKFVPLAAIMSYAGTYTPKDSTYGQKVRFDN